MYFEVDGEHYHLAFVRIPYLAHQPRRPPTPDELREEAQGHLYMRVMTTVKLFKDTKDLTAPNGWAHEEICHASVRVYHKDQMTHEEGRKKALQRLTPFVLPALREPMWHAYMNRVKRGER